MEFYAPVCENDRELHVVRMGIHLALGCGVVDDQGRTEAIDVLALRRIGSGRGEAGTGGGAPWSGRVPSRCPIDSSPGLAPRT